MTFANSVQYESSSIIVFNSTPQVIEAFASQRVFFGRKSPIPDERSILFPKHVIVEPYANFPHRRLFNCGAFSYCETVNTPYDLQLGRFCSVAFGLSIFGVRHPMEWVTQSSITYDFGDDAGYEAFVAAHHDFMGQPHAPRFPQRHNLAAPVIQDDVWIGQNVQISRGITIGTGSVIAAGSVVTRDVAPYTVVAGVPARLIRMRFPDEIVARLLASRWWTYKPDVLFRFDFSDPVAFLDRFEAAREALEPFSPSPVTWTSIADLVSPRLVIETNDRHDCSLYLQSGWSVPEPEFTWALGTSSLLTLPATAIAGKRAIALDLFPVPYKRQVVEVTLFSGSESIAFPSQTVDPHESIVLPLDGDRISPTHPLMIQIDHPHCIKPRSINFNDDDRDLSVALRRIVIRP